MPVFRVTIKKSYLGEDWENRYYVRADTIADVFNQGVGILVQREREFHSTATQFVAARLDDNIPGSDVFFTISLGGTGLREPTNDLLPLFNTVRVDFSASTGGYPGRKYYRGVLGSGDILLGVIQPAVRTQVETILDNLFIELTDANFALVDADDDQHVNAVVTPAVAMRQLRRGRLRRRAPVVP